jgi:hypothetical protein
MRPPTDSLHKKPDQRGLTGLTPSFTQKSTNFFVDIYEDVRIKGTGRGLKASDYSIQGDRKWPK